MAGMRSGEGGGAGVPAGNPSLSGRVGPIVGLRLQVDAEVLSTRTLTLVDHAFDAASGYRATSSRMRL
jgi:hypothetical protein